jgi:NNP family nitrate/nitrite transporter-like MFS transporter
VYGTSLVLGGMFATMFSLPSGVIRALGGYLSDKFGARKVMYWVLGSSIIISFLLMFPKMEIITAGPGVMSLTNGTVTEITANEIIVNGKKHQINSKKDLETNSESSVFPVKKSWQEIVVEQNQEVKKKELLAHGITQINFSANLWVYLVLVILIGISWGIGKAAVYKHIPEYFPNEVGVVGGMVGLIGGLGGFLGPIIFGYLLNYTGLWTSSWIFIFLVSVLCLVWMHRTIIKAMRTKSPNFVKQIEDNQ